MTRVLFLDIDGVICTDRAYFASAQDRNKSILRTWDPVSIKLVERLCLDFDLKVVISSTWRHGNRDVPLMLLTHGFCGEFHKDDKTPAKLSGTSRGHEIRMWLDKHPEVTQFVIIDDSTDGIRGTELQKFHVETHVEDGFLTHNYKHAVQLLRTMNNGNLVYSRKDHDTSATPDYSDQE